MPAVPKLKVSLIKITYLSLQPILVMRSFSVLHIFFLFILLLAYQCSKAQGFLVTTSGDTLRGDLRIIGNGNDERVVITIDKKKSSFDITKVRAFSRKGELFHPMRYPSGYTFMKVVRAGYLSLYSFRQPGQTTYDGLLLVKRDGSRLEVPNLLFKKLVADFLSDCEDVSTRIGKGEYSKHQVALIVDDYNQCLAQRAAQNEKAATEQKKVIEKSEVWQALREKVEKSPDFDRKNESIEMLAEIVNKLRKREPIPKFLLEGIKASLANTAHEGELSEAIKTLE